MKNIRLFLLFTLLMGCLPAKSQAFDTLKVYPNPFLHNLYIDFKVHEPATVSLELLNETGDRVYTVIDSVFYEAGEYLEILYGDTLPAGIYIVYLMMNHDVDLTMKVIKVDSATGIKAEKKEGLRLYPNPAGDVLYVPWEGTKNLIFTNSAGKAVYTFQTYQNHIFTEELPGGQYVVSVLNGKGEVIAKQKMIIRH